MQIAIDGPAGAGKSTIAKKVAAKLGAVYMDTGAMYRGVAVHMTDAGIPPQDKERVEEEAGRVGISLAIKDDGQHVIVCGEDVTGRIRTEEAGKAASAVSAYPKVREMLVARQREIAGEMDVVMDGRDIGTVVLPDATLKIFLTASVEERAKRRYLELIGRGVPESSISIEEIESDIAARDLADMTRECSPLKKADDAIEVDTTGIGIDEVTERICALYREAAEK